MSKSLRLGLGVLVAASSAGCAAGRTQSAAPQGAPVYAPGAPVVAGAGGAPPAAAHCVSVEVAPGVFRSTDCERRPAMVTSPFAARFQLPSVRTAKGFQPVSAGQLPGSVDHRATPLDGPVKDQGQVGVCWSMAMSSVVDNELRRSGVQETAAPLHLIAHDAYLNLYRREQTRSFTREAVWRYEQKRACKLKDYAEDNCGQKLSVQQGSWKSDPALVAESQAADAQPFYQMVSAEVVGSPLLIAAALAQGRQAYVSLNIDHEYWSYRKLQGGVLADYTSHSLPHAVTAVGYRTMTDGERQFLLKNSWGTSWGEGGYAWIRESTLARNLQDAFVIQVRDTRGQVFPGGMPSVPGLELPWLSPGLSAPGLLPAPWGAAPASSACPSGTSRDAVLGTCLPTCSGGSAPALGLCLPGAPAAPAAASSSCTPGQVREPLTQQCSAPCPSGLPPVAGVCWAG